MPPPAFHFSIARLFVAMASVAGVLWTLRPYDLPTGVSSLIAAGAIAGLVILPRDRDDWKLLGRAILGGVGGTVLFTLCSIGPDPTLPFFGAVLGIAVCRLLEKKPAQPPPATSTLP